VAIDSPFTWHCCNRRSLAAQGKLHEALEGLLNLEKTARQAEDIAALRAACSAVLATCYSAKEWKLLEENIVLLSKRRGQLRQVIQSFVRQAMGYIDSTPDKATKVSLITTLQTVTEGKVGEGAHTHGSPLRRAMGPSKEGRGWVCWPRGLLSTCFGLGRGPSASALRRSVADSSARLCRLFSTRSLWRLSARG
jgi:hypothetical protein